MTPAAVPHTAAARSAALTHYRIFTGETVTAWLFILPNFIGFFFFYAFPAARGLIISFTAWNLLRDPNPVGLANYREMIADPLFWNALKITGIYVLANIPLQTVLGLLLAVLMSRLTTSVLVRGVMTNNAEVKPTLTQANEQINALFQ